MLTIREVKYNSETFDEYITRSDGQSCEQSLRETESMSEALWSYCEHNEMYLFDLQEQIYRKTKVYFHISDQPLQKIDPKTHPMRSVPAVFFAMQVPMTLDFFKFKFGSHRIAYLHRCINNRPMNLFNPDSNKDFGDLPSNIQNDLSRKIVDTKRRTNRHWEALEHPLVIKAIYDLKKFDGIALDFFARGKIASNIDKTEGFCIFDKSISAIKLLDCARIDNVSKVNLRNLDFKPIKDYYN